MKLFVAVTDNDWFELLRSLPDLDEVNFWQPGGNHRFRALDPGEPLLFKLHSPKNFIVGGGFFLRDSIIDSQLAWEAFGVKNGATSFSEMRRRIAKYRRSVASPFESYDIGCILLQQPFFFDEIDWIPVPANFSRNIVVGKTYSTTEAAGHALWQEVEQRLVARPVDELAPEQASLYGEPILVRPRLGQGSFRIIVTDTYERHCAITGEKALPALEACHIRPVSEGGQHRIDNGLLFRSDVHRLFDRGYVTVTPDHRFRVSQRLKTDFANGEPYYPLHGKVIWLPAKSEQRPSSEFLEWHADAVFRR